MLDHYIVRNAIGNGNNTAITEPITGIKFKIKVNVPNINASSKPKTSKLNLRLYL